MLSTDELLLQIAILAEICIKMRCFLLKNSKNRPALWSSLPDPRRLGALSSDARQLLSSPSH